MVSFSGVHWTSVAFSYPCGTGRAQASVGGGWRRKDGQRPGWPWGHAGLCSCRTANWARRSWTVSEPGLWQRVGGAPEPGAEPNLPPLQSFMLPLRSLTLTMMATLATGIWAPA